MTARSILLTALAFSALAWSANAAQTDGEAVSRAKIALESVRPTTPATAKLNYARFATTRVPGVAQTSIQTRFSSQGDAVGDAGLLCGLLPHPDTSGAAAAFGHDPDGKFVGSKFSLKF